MSKYLRVFGASWQNEFTYRANFVLWRLRNVLRLLLTYFLWRGIFTTNQNVFGYSGSEMLAYVFLVLAVQALVLSSSSADNMGGEIASGDISNYLVKPISYIKYWFTRDLSSKVLNLIFAVGEVSLLAILLRPQLSLSSDIYSLVWFLVSVSVAAISYYFLSISARFVSFWAPENTWGISFVILILVEVLAGGIFPLDILPTGAQVAAQFTPFPYLVYYPISILTGKITGAESARIILQSSVWMVFLMWLSRHIWRKGLIAYSSEGR